MFVFSYKNKIQNSKLKTKLENQIIDCDGLKRLLKIKNKELKTMKNLSQTILDQRSDVEHFFLESLEYVKTQIQNTKTKEYHEKMKIYRDELNNGNIVKYNQKYQRQYNKNFQNDLNSNRESKLPEKPSDKIDIKDLSWNDRERVLRLLFSRINSSQDMLASTIPTTTNEIEDHSLPSSSSSSVFTTQKISLMEE